MGVILQAFYWDCPELEKQEFEWWNFLQDKVPALSDAGFTAIWLPPIGKAAQQRSMGYNPFDYYDLGDFDQKGGKKTWFGNEAELKALIASAHQHKIDVYVDMVLNHNDGGELEMNQLDNVLRKTKFEPASGKFPKNWESFHPCRFEMADESSFNDMPDVCHRNPDVYIAILEYAQWLLKDIGVDGFRFDFVKGYGAWIVRAIQELRGLRNNIKFSPFGVGERWDSDRNIYDWLAEVNTWNENPINAFDFPLRYRLKELCMNPNFDLRTLADRGTLLTDGFAATAVTFIENHDVVRGDAVIDDKLLGYSYILTHEVYPCVFWQDYFNWNLAGEDTPNGIAALIKAHEKYAGGNTVILHADEHLYIIQRGGWDTQPGLIYVLNTDSQWNGTWVKSQWKEQTLSPIAWWSNSDTAIPENKQTNIYGWGDFWAPPRGYAVYVPVSA